MFGKSWDLTPAAGEVVVQFQEGSSGDLRDAVAVAHGLDVSHPYNEETRVAVYRASAGEDALSLAALLNGEVGVAGAGPAAIDQDGYTKYVIPGRVSVQFRKELEASDHLAFISDAGCEVLVDHWTPGYFTVSLPEGMTLFEAVRMWQAHPQTLFSEPSYMLYDDLLYEPNDPHFVDEWYIRNTGDFGGGVPDADVDADLAWDLTKGDPDVIISVIDTGMDTAHPDLAGNLLPQNGEDWNFASGASSDPMDTNGHGTSCSGITAAVQDNALGVTGVAPGCRLMPLKVDLSSGANENRADAINYATSRRPEFSGLVISGSWRMSSGSFTAVEAACQNAWDNDVVLCFASGNDNGPITPPAIYPTTIAVGAASPCDERKSPTSCDGESWWGSNYGSQLDVVSPGVKMYTTDISGAGGYSGGDYFTSFNGTSSATPLCAGVCALIWSMNPALSNAEVRQILTDTAEDEVGPPGEDTPGWDAFFGYGRINAHLAVQSAVPAGFEDDMEAGEGPWTHEIVLPGIGFGDAWHLSQTRNHTPGGVNSWKCGDTADGDYSPEISAALVSPPLGLPQGAILEFWHWMDVNETSDDIAGDGGVVELSNDGGQSWFVGVPSGDGYSHTWRAGGTGSPFLPGQKVWSGSFDWRMERINLAAYSGAIRIRFRFGTRGEEPTGEGWYIDDVVIRAESAGAPDIAGEIGGARLLAAWPNPASGSARLGYQLASPSSVILTVHDVSGRLVRRWDMGAQAAGAHQVAFDGRDGAGRKLSAGVYLYRVATGASPLTGRLVLVD
jgi:subtilisin family serine protease